MGAAASWTVHQDLNPGCHKPPPPSPSLSNPQGSSPTDFPRDPHGKDLHEPLGKLPTMLGELNAHGGFSLPSGEAINPGGLLGEGVWLCRCGGGAMPAECSCSSHFFFFFNKFIYLFIYFWLCWVFVSVRGLSPVAASGGHSSLRCAGLSLSRPLLLRSTGSRHAGSVVVAHGPSCSTACGILPDEGSNPCSLHWQAESQPLRHQGSPPLTL